jgi:hypothetical protein
MDGAKRHHLGLRINGSDTVFAAVVRAVIPAVAATVASRAGSRLFLGQFPTLPRRELAPRRVSRPVGGRNFAATIPVRSRVGGEAVDEWCVASGLAGERGALSEVQCQCLSDTVQPDQDAGSAA